MNSIKLHTAENFEDILSSCKRKKHTSVACESCRKLKIRCQGGSDNTDDLGLHETTCTHCAKLSKRCVWPEEDLRKRRRTSVTGLTKFSAPDIASSGDSVLNLNDVEHDASFPNEAGSRNGRSNEHGSRGVLSIDATSTKQAQTTKNYGVPYTTLQYYRHLGPTAIAPGYKKISLKVKQDSHETQYTTPEDTHHTLLPLFDAATDLPAATLLPSLLDAFFEYYGDNFCFLNRSHLQHLTRTGEASSFLICAMSALSSRFCDPGIFAPYFDPSQSGQQRERWEFSLPFIEQSKSLLMPLLSIPSCDVCAGLLFLALAEFGDNNEAGMWMFVGMSVRVAQELGLHRERSLIYSKIGQSPANDVSDYDFSIESTQVTDEAETFERSSQIILFWCVFAQDTYLSNGTGRVPSIKRDEVNVRLPNDVDVAIVRAGPENPSIEVKSSAYVQMVRLALDYAKSIELLNTEPRSDTPSSQEASTRSDRITNIRDDILRSHKSLPPDLRFGANNYQSAVRSGEAGPYLLMHFQFELQVAFLTQAKLAVNESLSKELDEVSLRENSGRALSEREQDVLTARKVDYSLYRAAIKSIVDLLTIAKMIDSRALWSTFWLNQALFHASCAYIGDMLRLQHTSQESFSFSERPWPLPSHTSPSVVFHHEDYPNESMGLPRPTAAEEYLALIAKTNYHFLRQAVKDMAKYYAGANWVDAVLGQRETGLRDVDLSIASETISTFVRLHDLRVRGEARVDHGGILPRTLAGEATTLSNTAHNDWPLDVIEEIPEHFDAQAFFDDYMFNEFAHQNELQL